MGMTPVEGLLMGTRSGDIDAGALVYLQEHFSLSVSEIQKIINKEGGLLGLSGVSSDYRVVEEAALSGNQNAQTALDVYHYRVKKYIGAYAAAMGGIDALAFTGGIGENSYCAREQICSDLGFLGIRLSEKLNKEKNGEEAVINDENGNVNVLIIPANEELMIAREIAHWAKSKV
jgi:acetate kinase